MRDGAADPALRQFERDAVVACLAMAAMALLVTAAWQGFGPAARMALGVLGGGLLMAFSYRAIKGAVDVLVGIAVGSRAGLKRCSTGDVDREHDDRGPANDGGGVGPADSSGAGLQPCPDDDTPPVLSPGRRAFLAVKFFTRYALLAVAAYVMLTCFRLHPVGVLGGATSPFIAALMQVGRMAGARARRQYP